MEAASASASSAAAYGGLQVTVTRLSKR
jgi:hypothetical protein